MGCRSAFESLNAPAGYSTAAGSPTATARRPALASLSLPQAYASNYSGHACIDRLLFVAEKSVGQPLELEALTRATDVLKRVRGAANLAPHGTATTLLLLLLF